MKMSSTSNLNEESIDRTSSKEILGKNFEKKSKEERFKLLRNESLNRAPFINYSFENFIKINNRKTMKGTMKRTIGKLDKESTKEIKESERMGENIQKINRLNFIRSKRSNLASIRVNRSILKATTSERERGKMKNIKNQNDRISEQRNWILSTNHFDLILFLIFLLLIKHVQCQQAVFPSNQFNQNRVARIWKTDEIFPINYNNQQAPLVNQTIAVQIDVTAKIKNIRFQSKEDRSKSLFVDLDLIQQWRDDRLIIPAALQLNPNPKLTLDYRFKQALWTPIMQITNTKQIMINSFFEPIVYIEINNRKQVFLNAKLSLELDCDSQLTKRTVGENQPERFGKTFGQFPFDSKECGIELISLSNSLDVVSMRWSNFELLVQETNEFTIESKRNEHCVTMTDSGSFSCLRIRFRLKRKSYYAFKNHMLPISLFVVIVYLTFWIPCLPSSNNQQISSLFNGHLIQVRIILLIYSLTAMSLKTSNDNRPLLLMNQESAYSSTNSSSLSFWNFMNLIFVLIATVEFILQLNQSSLRRFLVRKIIKDNKLNNQTQNYGSNSNRNAVKVQFNSNGLGNGNISTTINNSQDTLASNQSIESDNYSKQNGKNRNKSEIYLKMLGLKQQPNRHQSPDHLNSSETQEVGKDYKEEDEQQESVDWLDKLFRVFFPLFYIAFVILFIFISLIG